MAIKVIFDSLLRLQSFFLLSAAGENLVANNNNNIETKAKRSFHLYFVMQTVYFLQDRAKTERFSVILNRNHGNPLGHVRLLLQH